MKSEEEVEVDDGNLPIYGAVIEIIELPSMQVVWLVRCDEVAMTNYAIGGKTEARILLNAMNIKMRSNNL